MTTAPDFLIWHCAGCGAAAVGKKKPCDCATNVGCRNGPNGKRESTWWDEALLIEVPLELAKRIIRARGGFNEIMELEALIDAQEQP